MARRRKTKSLLIRIIDNFNERSNSAKPIDAHSKGIGGMALHAKKQIVATAGDDCTWKIWNLDN